METYVWIVVAALCFVVVYLLHAAGELRDRLVTLERANVEFETAIDATRKMVAGHAGDFVRLGHRLAALEGPRHLIGSFATHEGKDRRITRVEITGYELGEGGKVLRYKVRLHQDPRPSIDYTVAADQVTLE